MTKLKDVLEGKGGKGQWFTPEEIEGQTMVIVEESGMDYDIRSMESTKKFKDKKTGEEKTLTYYCVSVTDGKEVKDLHLTWTGLGQLAEKMPRGESWKGYQFVIDVVRAKGKLDIRVLGRAAPGTYMTQQTTIPEHQQQPGSEEVIAKILADLKFGSRYFADGIVPEANVKTAVLQAGVAEKEADAVFQRLKDKGLLYFHATAEGRGYKVT